MKSEKSGAVFLNSSMVVCEEHKTSINSQPSLYRSPGGVRSREPSHVKIQTPSTTWRNEIPTPPTTWRNGKPTTGPMQKFTFRQCHTSPSSSVKPLFQFPNKSPSSPTPLFGMRPSPTNCTSAVNFSGLQQPSAPSERSLSLFSSDSSPHKSSTFKDRFSGFEPLFTKSTSSSLFPEKPTYSPPRKRRRSTSDLGQADFLDHDSPFGGSQSTVRFEQKPTSSSGPSGDAQTIVVSGLFQRFRREHNRITNDGQRRVSSLLGGNASVKDSNPGESNNNIGALQKVYGDISTQYDLMFEKQKIELCLEISKLSLDDDSSQAVQNMQFRVRCAEDQVAETRKELEKSKRKGIISTGVLKDDIDKLKSSLNATKTDMNYWRTKAESTETRLKQSEAKIEEFKRKLNELSGEKLSRLSVPDLRALRVSVSEKFTESLKNIDDEITDRVSCVVCMEPKDRAIFLPCQHQKVCAECATELKHCPYCRKYIEETVHPNRPPKKK
eukprot:530320_1